MIKQISVVILSILSASLAASAAVPLRWTVETSRATPAVFEAYQGETLAFEAALQSDGKPLAGPSEYALYWQTNGMGSTYWSAPCTLAAAATNVLFATWSPTNDVGARAYNCFIGAPGTIYHAAFQLRLRPSPGATPNALPLPQPVIDFDRVTVLNPPWSAGGEYLPLSGGTLTGDLNLQNDEPGRPTPKITVGSEAHQGMTTVDETGIGQSCARGPGVDRGFRIENDEGTVKIKKIGWTSDKNVEFTLPDVGGCLVTDAQTEPIRQAANDASAWSVSTYNFMTGGRTNCWFSGTNYVFGAEAAARTRFAWEDGMDAATVPCSMSLWEIRDGERQVVWDQRDWTAWYWTFKARQMQAEVDEKIAALGNAVTNDANYAWAKRYASDGTPNPDASTTFIDTPSVTLSPGMKWETVATVSGSAYWTIVGNGAVIGGSGTNATLRILDFEGNDIMTVTKGEHRLAYLEQGEITDGPLYDGNGWVCFDMLADAEPVGYFSVTLDASDFIEQTDPDCPAQCSWEDLHNGKYRVHFLLKPGIQARSCFAKFKVEVEGQTVIRYNAGQEISGGLLFNGVKIAPDVSGNPAVGTVIQWKVVR